MREIALTKGLVTVIDDADFDMLAAYRWHAASSGGAFYAKHSQSVDGKSRPLWMHRFIMGSPVGMIVDHIDGNPLNNRRANLRVVTHAQNMKNQRKSQKKGGCSPYKGVSRRGSKWIMQMKADYVQIRSGPYETALEAAFAYDEMARKHHGEFARLNFPT